MTRKHALDAGRAAFANRSPGPNFIATRDAIGTHGAAPAPNVNRFPLANACCLRGDDAQTRNSGETSLRPAVVALQDRFTFRRWQTDNHRDRQSVPRVSSAHGEARRQPRSRGLASGIRPGKFDLGGQKGRELPAPAGTRASANTSGPDPTARVAAREIADLKRSAPNEENLFLLPDQLQAARAPISKFDPAV